MLCTLAGGPTEQFKTVAETDGQRMGRLTGGPKRLPIAFRILASVRQSKPYEIKSYKNKFEHVL